MSKILAIDDKQDNLLVLKAVLKNFMPAITLVTALSGQEGLEKAAEESPDTILLDVKMPKMDGYEVCRQLRSTKQTENIPIIMLTAVETNSESRAHGLNAGADAFLTKPIEENELVAQIKAMLRIKKAEDLLRHEKESLQDLALENLKKAQLYLDIARVLIVALDVSGNITLMNQYCCNLLGVKEKDTLGKNWFDYFIPKRIANEVKSAFYRLMNGETELVEYYENPVFTANGEERFIAFQRTIIKDKGGTVNGILFSGEDITERKLAVKALQESEKKYRALFENEANGIFIYEPSTMIILDANPAMSSIYGYSHEELLRLNCLYLSDEVDKPQKATSKAEKNGRFSVNTRWHKKKDGTVFPVELDIYTVHLKGKVHGYTVVSDITERIKAEEEKLQLEARLTQSEKMEAIGTLAGGIAHDFNNILSAVIGFTELALDAVEKETPIQEDLQEVYTAGLRAKALVHQISTFARQSDEELKPIQVDAIIKEVLKFIRSSIPTTIEIKQNIVSDSLIMGNTTQIHRIMMNLCTNAAHAMETKGGALEIILKDITIDRVPMRGNSHLKSGNYIEIKVSDTGDGIDPQIINKIFEPFFTTKGQGEGTGMGLAMVHGIVETYGGKIFVESKLGKGTIFTIHLPVARESKAHQQYKEEEFPTGQERILFVDDEAQIAKMAGRMLGQLGYSVTTKTSSVDALDVFRAKPSDFDLVISDVTMPKMTGDQLAKELLEIRPDIPVILCTGYSKRLSEEKSSEIGIKAFAHKPIVKEDLATTVRRVLDKAKA